MITSTTLQFYEQLLQELETLVVETEKRVIDDPPDALFKSNINFFVKCYLITLCTYLESFLQKRASELASRIDSELEKTRIPSNIVHWSVTGTPKDKDLTFGPFKLSINDKDINDLLSGNPGKTINLFRLLGADLRATEAFERRKGIVGSVVDKRNKIVHHNDSASDITTGDIRMWKAEFVEYMRAIDSSVEAAFPVPSRS